MRVPLRVVVVLSSLLFLPVAAFAQGAIAGQVKDASGGVLPGVTVEAASPVLIEKTRTVVSDGSGNYRVENLRPGTYTVTFTLTGFSTIKRDSIDVSGSAGVSAPSVPGVARACPGRHAVRAARLMRTFQLAPQ